MKAPYTLRAKLMFSFLLLGGLLQAQVRMLPHHISIRSNPNSISGSTVLELMNETNTTGYGFSFDEQENLAIAETNVGTRFFIKKGGNIGIGTTAPMANLEIQNVNNTTDNNYLLALHNQSNTEGSSALISFSGSAAELGVGGFNPAVFGFVRGGGFVWKETSGSGDPPTTMSLRNGNLNVTGSVTATQFIGDGSLLTGIGGGGSSAWTENGGNVYRSSGNVGIGVSNPSQALHVNGSVRADNGEFQSSGAIVLHPDVDQSGDDIVRFLNSEGQTTMEIDGNGNVGIGMTPVPLTGLALRRALVLKSQLIIEENDNTIGIIGRAGSNLVINSYQNGAAIRLQTGSVTRVTINDAGNMGIGTTTIPAAYKLAVDGRVICENVRVQNSTAWPDFVFEEDYELPPLQEVEAFITREKHLPDMPSAGEVDAEGIDVSLMQNKLLQKVEELTLYTIQQQKQIEAQQEQIAALSEMLKAALQQMDKK